MANTSNQNFDRIYRLQKRIATSIFDTDYKHPSLPLFVKLGVVRLVTICNRIIYFRCLTVYKALNNAVFYISGILRHFTSVHNINAKGSASCLLKLPRVRTTYQSKKTNVCVSCIKRLELFE